MVRAWPEDELRALPLEALDERYRRYRLSVPEAERAMAGSLRPYGPMSPVVVCVREERAVLVDGFNRLTAGNQAEALAAARRESLTAEELRGVVDLLLASGTREKAAFVLDKPRQALRQVQQPTIRSWDPRLRSAGNRVSRQLGLLLDQRGRMENWLHHRGRGELALCDRRLLGERFQHLVQQGRMVAELTEDFFGRAGLALSGVGGRVGQRPRSRGG